MDELDYRTPSPVDDRYLDFSPDIDQTVIFDEEETEAWIQSDNAYRIEEIR